jgi:hypothetical protein
MKQGKDLQISFLAQSEIKLPIDRGFLLRIEQTVEDLRHVA